ncbi:ABC-2 type transport system permease protein [Nakamurella panacisegetis]|uniref:ABC-2 type transport system permease protein n=1 Tax=Nakamurella panacisegetis TaxID=1090615 RepID=A0A1H0MAJ4_9ACTN|nr:hypothetical protein [Nakamurella panacisegetis]SDO77397.1 ABC-2 type transport system permease protein [Nakamurella panacisegetis]
MMSLIKVERIKLLSTKSPYWCVASILVASVLIALVIGLSDHGSQATTVNGVSGVNLGKSVFMIIAALAVTTEYRFNTMKSTFLAAPHRVNVLLAKTVLLAVFGAVLGFVCAIAAFFLTKALATNPPIPLVLEGEVWREVAGYAALFAIAAVIAVAVGTLLRQSAGAISLLLVWSLLFESLFQLIPKVGDKIHAWMPFTAGTEFVSPTSNVETVGRATTSGGPTPIQGLLVFLATGIVLWLIAAVVLNKRDA